MKKFELRLTNRERTIFLMLFTDGEVYCGSEWEAQGAAGIGAVKPSVVKPPPVGGLFPAPDVQSLWSFDMKTDTNTIKKGTS